MNQKTKTSTASSSRFVACLLSLLGLCMLPLTASADELCTTVKIQISQQLVLTRTIFTATLEMQNETGTLLQNVELDFTFQDLDGNDASGNFFLHEPELSGSFTGPALPSFTSPTGYSLGALLPASTGTVGWPIEPLQSATPDGVETNYVVGGVLRYTKNGTVIATPLFPQTITVAPAPRLVLNYYLQGTVWADDPLTPEVIEPIEPFILGLRLQNIGEGDAVDVKLSTDQPQITENDSELIIAFKILSAAIGCNPATPKLDLEIGDILPGESQVLTWEMASTLKGNFVDITSSFVHKGFLGEGVIDVEASGAHLSVHPVKLGSLLGEPVVNDELPDFLVNLGAGEMFTDPTTGFTMQDVPSRVDSSDGSSFVVEPNVQSAMDSAPTAMDLVTSTQIMFDSTGWKYVRLNDEGQGQFTLAQVVRNGPDSNRVSFSVGKVAQPTSAWTTARNVNVKGTPTKAPDTVQYLAHLFNHISVPGLYTYDFIYSPVPSVPLSADNQVLSVSIGGQQNLLLNAGPERGGHLYYIVGTKSGTSPGTPLGSLLVPINIDSYTLLLINSPGINSFFQFTGHLDGSGKATARVIVPPGTNPALAGIVANHAFVLYNPTSFEWDFVSNPVELYLAP